MSSDLGYGYGAAIDAGSSGSRIYLYRWRLPSNDRLASKSIKVEQEAIFSDERTPGINDKHDIGIGMLEELVLVALAETALPPDVDPGDVPIYLGATAGMRIIDPAFEADIMSRIRSILLESRFLFRDDWARTISGEEEGAYDWLTINYLKNNGNFPTSATTQYGALDLGGASTQISFPASVLTKDLFPLRIDQVEYPLYTQSFLHYGVDQARRQYDAKFASHTKSNPCYPTGYTNSNSGISGSSNWEECLQSVAVLFDQTQNCNGCWTGGPPIADDQKFILMSAFVYTWDFLGLRIGEFTDDLDALNARGQRVCNMTQKQQIAQFRNHRKHNSLDRITLKHHSQCFNAAFSYHLLSKGYGMPVSQTPIEIHDSINGTKVQWCLGLMLVEANKLSSIFKESGQQLDIYSMENTYKHLIMFSVVVLIFLTWIFGYLPYRLKRLSSSGAQKSHLPLFNSCTTKRSLGNNIL